MPKLPSDKSEVDPNISTTPLTWADHISIALDESGDNWESTGDGRSAKEIIARQLVGLAMSGDKKAIEIILDRIEGKPRQAIDRVQRDPDEIVELG